jgi:hypothetical protein
VWSRRIMPTHSRTFKRRLKRDPEFLLKIITGDGTWVYKYDPETKEI